MISFKTWEEIFRFDFFTPLNFVYICIFFYILLTKNKKKLLLFIYFSFRGKFDWIFFIHLVFFSLPGWVVGLFFDIFLDIFDFAIFFRYQLPIHKGYVNWFFFTIFYYLWMGGNLREISSSVHFSKGEDFFLFCFGFVDRIIDKWR